MKASPVRKRSRSLAVAGPVICLIMLTACGNGVENKVITQGPETSTSPGNAVAASSPTMSDPTATGNPSSPAGTKTPETPRSESKRVSNDPQPQIGTGGTDMSLFTLARVNLAADAEISKANIVIDVKAGVVTLSGTVATPSQKVKAEELVRSVEGVKAVKNQLRVSGG